MTSVQRVLADVYAARDESLFPKNKNIEDAIDLDYQNTRERHFERKKDQLEKRIEAELKLLQSKAHTRQMQIKTNSGSAEQSRDQSSARRHACHRQAMDRGKDRAGMNTWGGQKLGSLPESDANGGQVCVLNPKPRG